MLGGFGSLSETQLVRLANCESAHVAFSTPANYLGNRRIGKVRRLLRGDNVPQPMVLYRRSMRGTDYGGSPVVIQHTSQ